MLKLTRFIPGLVKQSPTSGEVPPTSANRSGHSSRSSAAPEELSRRNCSDATAPAQRSRGTSKFVHAAKKNLDAASIQAPPIDHSETWNVYQDRPKPMTVSKTVTTWQVPDEQARQPAARNQGPQISRSQSGSAHSNTDQSSQEVNRAPVVRPPPVWRPDASHGRPQRGLHAQIRPALRHGASCPIAMPLPAYGETTLTPQPSSSSGSTGGPRNAVLTHRHAPPRDTVLTQDPSVHELVAATPPVTGRSRRTRGRVTPEPNKPLANNQAGSNDSTPAGTPLPWNNHTPPGELRSRRRMLTDTTRQAAQQTMAMVTQAARHVHLSQAKQAVADASITRAIGSTAMRLVEAPARLAAQTTSVLGHSGASWFNRPRLSSQALQLALGGDLGQPESQAHAHHEAVRYGKHAATRLDTALPVAHAMLKIGGAGTSMAFGLGYNSGRVSANALGRTERGAEQSPGLRAGPELPAAALSSDTALKLGATGLQQWLLGSATGAVGNMAGQYLAAPLVNLIPRQFQKIDDLAVLPQQTQDLMNLFQPGAGDALRVQVQKAQSEIANIDSESNKTLGKIAFGSVFAARFASMATPLGAAGHMLSGLVMSAGAGIGIGAVMATRQATTTLQIPDLEGLFAAVKTLAAEPHNGEAALAAVHKHAVPLFYARHAPPAPADHPQPADIETGDSVVTADAPQRGRLATMASSTLDAVRWGAQKLTQPLAVVGQTWAGSLSASPLLEPALPDMDEGVSVRRVLGTASNVAASGLNRAHEMAASTAMTLLLSTGANMLSVGIDGPARRVALAVLNSVGIQFAIVPWFNALSSSIPKFDSAIQAHRQQVVSTPADK